jgi:probable rRNA maturation factor
MILELDYQLALEGEKAAAVPTEVSFRRWAEAALQGRREEAELTIRVVDEVESAELNSGFRKKQGPTNVLSFNFEPPPGIALCFLGDIVICAPVVAREAREQDKTPEAHWAHMVIHGSLHLLGYDHIDPTEAEAMESLETEILASLGYPNPYE